MTAPVSLGQIKERGAFPDGHVRLSQKERDALVELAESYLAVRALEEAFARCRAGLNQHVEVLADFVPARARLAAAAGEMGL